MAKRLLLNALVLVLGEFIELNEESLDLAVWSGSIILHDLKLKTESLLRNTDFTILQGKIKSLEIVVPWASLLSSPIKITINGKSSVRYIIVWKLIVHYIIQGCIYWSHL